MFTCFFPQVGAVVASSVDEVRKEFAIGGSDFASVDKVVCRN